MNTNLTYTMSTSPQCSSCLSMRWIFSLVWFYFRGQRWFCARRCWFFFSHLRVQRLIFSKKNLLQGKPRKKKKHLTSLIRIQTDSCSFSGSQKDNRFHSCTLLVVSRGLLFSGLSHSLGQLFSRLMICPEYSLAVCVFLVIDCGWSSFSPSSIFPGVLMMIMPARPPSRAAIKLPNGPPGALLWTCCHFDRNMNKKIKKNLPFMCYWVRIYCTSFHTEDFSGCHWKDC